MSEPERCNCTALRQSSRHVTRLYDEALAPVGVGVNQYSILARLDRFGPKSIGDLARLLVMDRSTLGHLLRPLEKRGFVALAISEADRRSRAVVLTPAGRSLVEAARPLWAAAQARFEAAFGQDAAVALRQTLREVVAVSLDRPRTVTSGSPSQDVA